MTKEERLALIEQLQWDNAQTQADMAARRQRQLEGIDPIPDDVVQRHAPEVIYKTNPNALVQPQPQPSEHRMVGVSDELKEYHGKLMAMLDVERADDTALLQELADAIASLRADLEELRSEFEASRAEGNADRVLQWPKGHQHVA